jgi:hypothetical protein
MKIEQHMEMRQSKRGEKDVTAIATILVLFLDVNNCFRLKYRKMPDFKTR